MNLYPRTSRIQTGIILLLCFAALILTVVYRYSKNNGELHDLPDFFLTNTSVSNVDFFALNSETYLITKEGIPYLYCQNYSLPENQ